MKRKILSLPALLFFISANLICGTAYSIRCQTIFGSQNRTLILPSLSLDPIIETYKTVDPKTKHSEQRTLVRADFPRTRFYYEAELIHNLTTKTNRILLDLKLVDVQGNVRVDKGGAEIFREIMSTFGIKEVSKSSRSLFLDRLISGNRKTTLESVWTHDSVNFISFRRQVEAGLPVDIAAANTWSGRQAAKYGLRKITVDSYVLRHSDPDSQVAFVNFSNY